MSRPEPTCANYPHGASDEEILQALQEPGADVLSSGGNTQMER
jgi:hypothetical protein